MMANIIHQYIYYMISNQNNKKIKQVASCTKVNPIHSDQISNEYLYKTNQFLHYFFQKTEEIKIHKRMKWQMMSIS